MKPPAKSAPSPVPWKRVAVFVSSIPPLRDDMHAERDYLVKRVFPDLHDWCEQRRLRLVDVDLRWGVTEADATQNRDVVQTCLKRIDECRPFFVCFVGQRCGWVPMPQEVHPRTPEDKGGTTGLTILPKRRTFGDHDTKITEPATHQ